MFIELMRPRVNFANALKIKKKIYYVHMSAAYRAHEKRRILFYVNAAALSKGEREKRRRKRKKRWQKQKRAIEIQQHTKAIVIIINIFERFSDFEDTLYYSVLLSTLSSPPPPAATVAACAYFFLSSHSFFSLVAFCYSLVEIFLFCLLTSWLFIRHTKNFHTRVYKISKLVYISSVARTVRTM